ncbi:hypothetical protein QE197_14385 [Arsenophonus nasoniae]|uniref:Uncharacterized protein n=1 Tax=Arsenophonus nasoniae TaxID=638 RepID=D2U1H2_9GAMM|nr:hypothetical protein [Arsenophonus nasoniae]QBY44694.1 hypothetical protein ArsFIN_32800 [Arsenophonus nasoniae]WGM00878.1 hypothetical protein QE210_13625 [Arsenophonus nasoniae]WGM04924.1 hypothetical protein QE258_15235 [Arsenophonus nasoniae]WGM10021.1 hypothetical protein QE197_14385 [Arsenophonus nasoniae]WGM14736.1 hypothetical protein QE193_14300 [Arsenophonus nasoniae]
MNRLFKIFTAAFILGLSSYSFAQDGNSSDNKTDFGKAEFTGGIPSESLITDYSVDENDQLISVAPRM